jgi:hypothetical protein
LRLAAVWSVVKERLPAGDNRVRKLAELITQVTVSQRPGAA